MSDLSVVEICAGAGGQSLGLELAGFDHELAVELDQNAANTLRANRDWTVAVGDVADRAVWNPADFEGVGLLAGGVPCPPFSIAGKQLGATDERDLFAWAVELVGTIRPRALLLENVRGLSQPRFAAYRQHVRDRLASFGYWSDWRLLQASDYGVPQLRPRFVLVALSVDDAPWFSWPEPERTDKTVGSVLRELMASDGWARADEWANDAKGIAPTIVGGSKRHGGADLGPTRAKAAWRVLGVDGRGIADAPPPNNRATRSKLYVPRLTNEMVARIQGWDEGEYAWTFTGLKTSRYRQIGNAFPAPVARCVGDAIRAALLHEGAPRIDLDGDSALHDDVYRVLRDTDGYASAEMIRAAMSEPLDDARLEARIQNLSQDFVIDIRDAAHGPEYKLVEFKGFIGQESHARHLRFSERRSKIS